MSTRHADLYYYEGEKPPPTPVKYEDLNGSLIASISGAALSGKVKIDEESEITIDMTNNDDGTMTLDWDTGTSQFIIPASNDGDAVMRIDIEVTQGAAVWFLPRWSVPVRKRA